MNPDFLVIGVMAAGAAAIAAASLRSLAAGGALFLLLSPLVNVEVAFGETGRSVSYDKLALIALAAGFAWRVLRSGGGAMLKRRPLTLYAWLAWLAWSLAAAWLSGAPVRRQFWGLAEAAAYFITFLAFLDICAREASRERILRALLCGGLVMVAAVVLQNLAFHVPWKIRGWHSSFRADLFYSPFPLSNLFFYFRPGPIGNPNFLAAWLLLWAASVPLIFRFSRRAGFIACAALPAIFALNGSQGGLIGFAILVLALLWIGGPRLMKMLSARVSPAKARLLLPLAGASVLLFTAASVATHSGFMETSVPPRVYIHRVAGKMIAERPWAGHGSGLFLESFLRAEKEYADKGELKIIPWRTRAQKEGRPLHAHSSYLNAFVETGLPGGVLFLCLMAGGLLEALLHLRKTGRLSPGAPEAWAWAGCAGVLFQAGTEIIFSFPKTACLYWALMALCLTARKAADHG